MKYKQKRKVEILERKEVFKQFLTVEDVILRFEKFDGSMSEPVSREICDRGDAVAALVYHRGLDAYLLVEQFRLPTLERDHGWLLEIVAGSVEEGEDHEETVRREIEEEVGYKPHLLRFISYFYPSPGSVTERVFLYYAEVSERDRVSDGGGLDSEHEDLAVHPISPKTLWQMFEQGELHDAKTIIALLWAKEHMR